jgi:hypothetical protein
LARAIAAQEFYCYINPRWQQHLKEGGMELGAFSITLAVKDITTSKTFYEKLGFSVIGGDISQNW